MTPDVVDRVMPPSDNGSVDVPCGAGCPTGQRCVAGQCECAPGRMLCGSMCVMLETDVSHCGMCGRACPPPSGTNALAACERGMCGMRCEANFGDCDGMAANGCEASLAGDPMRCGSCTTSCSASQLCGDGRCRPASMCGRRDEACCAMAPACQTGFTCDGRTNLCVP